MVNVEGAVYDCPGVGGRKELAPLRTSDAENARGHTLLGHDRSERRGVDSCSEDRGRGRHDRQKTRQCLGHGSAFGRLVKVRLSRTEIRHTRIGSLRQAGPGNDLD